MEKNYYEELLQTLAELMEKQNYDEAERIILDEFRMPYIPMDVEEKLNEYYREIRSGKSRSVSLSYSDEEIYDMLAGSDEDQLKVIGYLQNSNLRNYLDALKDYLKEDHLPLLKSLVFELMISQQITDEVTMKAEGVSYTFVPCQIEPPFLTDGYEKASEVIRETLGKDNPSAAQLAETLLRESCYLRLPLNYEEEEGEYLAYGCIRRTLHSLGSEDLWQEYMRGYGVNEDLIWEKAN